MVPGIKSARGYWSVAPFPARTCGTDQDL